MVLPAVTRSPISMSRSRDRPAEGRGHVLEARERQEAVDLGLVHIDSRFGRRDFRDARVHFRFLLVALLFGNDPLRRRRLPSARTSAWRNPPPPARAWPPDRLFDLGLGCVELIVEFGRFDDGQRLSLLDLVADVDEPLADVAVGAGVDRGFVQRSRPRRGGRGSCAGLRVGRLRLRRSVECRPPSASAASVCVMLVPGPEAEGENGDQTRRRRGPLRSRSAGRSTCERPAVRCSTCGCPSSAA